MLSLRNCSAGCGREATHKALRYERADGWRQRVVVVPGDWCAEHVGQAGRVAQDAWEANRVRDVVQP